jgi:hypothetical protein
MLTVIIKVLRSNGIHVMHQKARVNLKAFDT